jgi:anti-sigma factor ChrR (cupin superfamily)
MYEEPVQDPYQARGKLPEPSVCPDCGAVFHNGRWQWGAAPESVHQHLCPACSRIHDKVPAGILTLSGDFFETHKEEIMGLIRNAEEKEKAEHPLERIMAIEEQAEEQLTVITYTSIHLTKGTGEALHHAYHGEFDFEYADRDGVLHASWKR